MQLGRGRMSATFRLRHPAKTGPEASSARSKHGCTRPAAGSHPAARDFHLALAVLGATYSRPTLSSATEAAPRAASPPIACGRRCFSPVGPAAEPDLPSPSLSRPVWNRLTGAPGARSVWELAIVDSASGAAARGAGAAAGGNPPARPHRDASVR